MIDSAELELATHYHPSDVLMNALTNDQGARSSQRSSYSLRTLLLVGS
jgi:hypothetical protein